MSYNGMIIASVNPFTKGAADKNGKMPVILNVVAGTCPIRNVLAGTIAESLKIEEGKTYLFSVREGEANEYGRTFVYSKLKELNAMEIVGAAKELGEAKIFAVETRASETKMEANTGFEKLNG